MFDDDDDQVPLMECANSECRRAIMNPNENYCFACRHIIREYVPYYILMGSVIGAVVVSVLCFLTHR
jgi:hypothetical protein